MRKTIIIMTIALGLVACGNKTGKAVADGDSTALVSKTALTEDSLRLQTDEETDSLSPEEREALEIRIMQNEALKGQWNWVGDNTPELMVTLNTEEGTVYVERCVIYGSNASFDLSCTYEEGVLHIFDTPHGSKEMASLTAKLQLDPRGDLVGPYSIRVGSYTQDGTLTLRMDYFKYNDNEE